MTTPQPLTPAQVAALAAASGQTRYDQAKALGVSTAQLGRYLRDGVTAKCSMAVRDRLVQAAHRKGVL